MTDALNDLSLEEGSLSIDGVRDGSTIKLRFSGDADLVDATLALEPLFEAVHVEALRLSVEAVVVDVTQLEYMNSSCFKAFVTWIDVIRQLDRAQQYRIRFVSNPAVPWQGRTLKSLQRFAADLVRLD